MEYVKVRLLKIHCYLIDSIYTIMYGKVSDYRPPPNTDPSRISVTMRDIKKVYIHEMLVI